MGDSDGISQRKGLRVDRAKAQAWQRDSARRYAIKRRAARSSARLTTRIGRSKSSNDWPPAVRRLARRRSGGVCEYCLTEPACDLHHRKARRFRDHRIANALHLCRGCHSKAHAAPSWAFPRGLRVRPHHDPAEIPVELNPDVRIFLTLTGDYREAA